MFNRLSVIIGSAILLANIIGCAADERTEVAGEDTVAWSEGDPRGEVGENGPRPQQMAASTECNGVQWAAAITDNWNKRSYNNTAPHITSCRVSGNLIIYTYVAQA